MRARPQRFVLGVAALLWIAVVGAGLTKLWSYSFAAGARGAAPQRWPADSMISRKPDEATLVMVAHPQCPCSRASVGELARIMAQTEQPLTAYVLFVKPEGFDEEKVQSDLWQTAATIPGVSVIVDDDGREARRFGAATSGQTMLYDRAGALVFSGGITAARGHAGDNAGRTAIRSLLGGQAAEQAETPVYGCALFASAADDTRVCAQ